MFVKSTWLQGGAANSSSGGNQTDNGENVPPPEEGSVEFADLVQQSRSSQIGDANKLRLNVP